MISRADIRAALRRSGYLLESRIDTVLREREQGYFVETNIPFADPDTGKSREMDLHAMTAWKAGPLEFDFAFARLLIECVNNTQPLALITKEPLLQMFNAEHVKLAGLPTMVPENKDAWVSLRNYLKIENYHHYCQGRIATQYCTFQRKRGVSEQWMAIHDDSHFGMFKALTDITESEISDYYSGWRVGPDEESVNLEFYYPILVVEGALLEIRPTRRGMRIASRDHLMYQRSSIQSGQSQEYQIDVVTERGFPRLLDRIESEMSRTTRLLRRRHEHVRRAVDGLISHARRRRTPQKIREALSFDG